MPKLKKKHNAIVLRSCTADNDIDHVFIFIIIITFKTKVLKPFLSYLIEIA